jgi:hypothetical protein
MVTKEWAAIHRKHHAKCETAEDPHSPQVYGIHRVLWTGGLPLRQGGAGTTDTLQRYGHGTPDDWLENHLYSPWHKLGVVIMLAIDVADLRRRCRAADLGRAGGLDSVLGGRRDQRPRPFLGLPEFQHRRRQHQYLALGILIGGEELHNNHHAFPHLGQSLSIAGTNSTSAGSTSASWRRWAWRRSRKVAPRPRLGNAAAGGGLRHLAGGDHQPLRRPVALHPVAEAGLSRGTRKRQDRNRFKGSSAGWPNMRRRAAGIARRLELLLGESRALHTALRHARGTGGGLGAFECVAANNCSRRCRTGASAPRTRVFGSCRNCRCACAATFWPDRNKPMQSLAARLFRPGGPGGGRADRCRAAHRRTDETATLPAVHLSAPALSADRLPCAVRRAASRLVARLWGVLLGLDR